MPILLLLLSVLLAGCLPSTNPEQPKEPTEGYELEVSPGRLILSAIGSSSSLNATLRNNGESVSDGVFSWRSSNPAIVTVDDSGKVVAQGEGAAQIVVTANGISRKADVVVSFGAIEVQGSVLYQDKRYSTSGVLIDESYKPVRNAIVDVMDLTGNVMMSTQTDDEGQYTILVLPSEKYVVRVLAKSAIGMPYALEVRDFSGLLYGVTQNLDLTNPSSSTLVISHVSGFSAVYNIFDVMMVGSEFMQQQNVGSLPSLDVYWESGKGQATYFCSGFHSVYCTLGEGVYVLGGASGDSDEFDDDVLWHEFGHYVARYYSRDDSPGGCHVLSSTNLDLRLAWSEGWGDFFPAAVKHWLKNSPELKQRMSATDAASTSYIDLSGNFALISLDIASAPSHYVDAGSEVATANVLYRFMTNYGMRAVWEVMQGYMPSVAPANLEAFWDGWRAYQSPSSDQLYNLEAILGSRKIYYQHDEHESDDSIGSSSLLDLNKIQTHHLYRRDGQTDNDVVKMNLQAGKTYEIKTFGIRNGGDTHLRLLNADGAVLAENDDAADAPAYVAYDSRCRISRITNNGDALASKISFTPSQSGVYYAKVRTTEDPVPHPSAGRYGSYSITVTQP
ncbi:MAG: pre-peptidase C-terminal domain-containing protein [Gammaproteobacteria bacterium]|nr:pre-peptidase C-terminal domain-containing protein [Gammaproteobacteria bacterium]